MFLQFLLNYPDQLLIRRVRAAAKTAQVDVPIPAKERFTPPHLAHGVHIDRSAIEACAVAPLTS